LSVGGRRGEPGKEKGGENAKAGQGTKTGIKRSSIKDPGCQGGGDGLVLKKKRKNERGSPHQKTKKKEISRNNKLRENTRKREKRCVSFPVWGEWG